MDPDVRLEDRLLDVAQRPGIEQRSRWGRPGRRDVRDLLEGHRLRSSRRGRVDEAPARAHARNYSFRTSRAFPCDRRSRGQSCRNPRRAPVPPSYSTSVPSLSPGAPAPRCRPPRAEDENRQLVLHARLIAVRPSRAGAFEALQKRQVVVELSLRVVTGSAENPANSSPSAARLPETHGAQGGSRVRRSRMPVPPARMTTRPFRGDEQRRGMKGWRRRSPDRGLDAGLDPTPSSADWARAFMSYEHAHVVAGDAVDPWLATCSPRKFRRRRPAS